MKKFLQELSFVQDKYLVFCDSQSVIHLGKNSTFHSRSKHIDVRYHNCVDMMTKMLLRSKFETCCEIANLSIIST